MTERPGNDFVRAIRLDERQQAIETFRAVMSGHDFIGRHVDDAVDEIIEAVQTIYERVEEAIRG